MINLPKWRIREVYKYIYFHDDETLLIKDIADAICFSEKTTRKYIRWLERHAIIQREGKHYTVLVK